MSIEITDKQGLDEIRLMSRPKKDKDKGNDIKYFAQDLRKILFLIDTPNKQSLNHQQK